MYFTSHSSTTKLCIVFDGSDQSTNGHSLNNLLFAGSSLYPLLSTIISQLWFHRIGTSGDILKMFREVSLAVSDRDLHRFIRTARSRTGECAVLHLESPFLVSWLPTFFCKWQKITLISPLAANVVKMSFYVDDCLTGVDNPNSCIQILMLYFHLLVSISGNGGQTLQNS